MIVRCENLEELKQKWDAIIGQHQQQLPDFSFVRTQFEFQQLVHDLRQHSRIQWFYYTDNSTGVALRLYDRPFHNAYSQHYKESPKNDGEEWVILRGKNLGSPLGPCKKEMRNAFGNPPDKVHLGKSTDDRIAFFEHPNRNNAPGAIMQPSAQAPAFREDPLDSVTQALRQFRQVILYGPPGTGKTRLARRAALALLAESGQLGDPSHFDAGTSEDEVRQRLRALRKQGTFDLVVFHPAYEYEQFVGGIAPQASGVLSYTIEPGIFLKMARYVENNRRPAVLMIDEINRGNLPKLLGELLYALEYRDEEVRLPFEWDGRSDLVVPKELYIIGTMNSSDRSIGHIDVAVRRRFGLLHIQPDAKVVRDSWRDSDPALGDQLAALMERLNKALHGADNGGELLVGHAYFLAERSLPDPRNQVEQKWAYQVQQLLREYGQLLTLEEDFFNKFPESLRDALLTN